jgi:trimeric autotransporter adhesin
MKKKLLPALIGAILSCYATTGHTQVGNNKSHGNTFPDNGNGKGHSWLLRGNSGTDPSKHFIGTRDAQPLVFKVNNQKAGYLDFSDTIQNTAFGYHTLNSNIVLDADYSTFLSAFGWGALSSNTTGWGNTAHGAGSLFSNTTGGENTGIGHFSLISNTTAAFNTAIGAFSLASNTTGEVNTATGDFALASNTTGSFNTANGTPFTLAFNTEGSENIATGAVSMGNNSTGNANVAYGVFSLASNETGSNNTALGSHADVTARDLNNATAIGAGALVDASNKVRIGNTDVTSIGGEVGWTSYSDERIKDNIRENVPGLEFIKALRPVTYHFSVTKENELLGIKEKTLKDISILQLKGIKIPGINNLQLPSVKDMADKKIKDITGEHNYEIEKIQFTGFLAQDVDKAAQNIGYDFSGVDKSGKIMGLRYSDFVVPLVKAVQELSKMNDEKDAKIDGLQKQIDDLRAMINGSIKTNVTLNDASLEQNAPNPFSKTTTIDYSLPAKFSHAEIIIVDKNGKMLKQVNISGIGKGTVNVDAATLSSGAYSYSLFVDGKAISSKQMLVTR